MDDADRQDGGDWRQAALDWAAQLDGASDAVRSSAQTGDADAARETAETVLIRLAEFMAALGLDICDYILVSAVDDGGEGPPE